MSENNSNSEVKIENPINQENKENTQTVNSANFVPKVKAQTFADDMAKVLETGQGGVIHRLIEEQEQKEAEEKNKSLTSNKNKVFVIVSILLFFSAIGVFFWINAYRKNTLTAPVQPKFTPMIFLDKTSYINVAGLTKDKIAQSVYVRTKATDVKVGGIEGIYLTQDNKIIGFRELINLISGNLPLEKATFLSDNYLIGVSNVLNNVSPDGSEKNLFILLQNRSMSDIFQAMKAWEYKMFFDLHGFFGVPINADTNYLLTKDFEDGIVQNKNARILRDNDGKIVLMYVYANNTSVLITNSENTTKEVMLRLAASQVKK
ncbi:MAG TPA: hypothetical protein PLO44_01350 [Candidatus Paceibacterota bacterium]|nr:hypothetical protein [Candidatus Paceibacterota bacterium]